MLFWEQLRRLLEANTNAIKILELDFLDLLERGFRLQEHSKSLLLSRAANSMLQVGSTLTPASLDH